MRSTRCTGRPSFQLTAARRRLRHRPHRPAGTQTVSTHSRSKAAALPLFPDHSCYIVSTHSRSKAAATNRAHDGTDNRGFNSQPLEGGCVVKRMLRCGDSVFQLTAARRRLRLTAIRRGCADWFQLTAARRRLRLQVLSLFSSCSFNSQPLEGGCACRPLPPPLDRRFQLTAARRRLLVRLVSAWDDGSVSTHSRSKAAAVAPGRRHSAPLPFQLTAARRRLQ